MSAVSLSAFKFVESHQSNPPPSTDQKTIHLEVLKREQAFASCEMSTLFKQFNAYASQLKQTFVQNSASLADLDKRIMIIKSECGCLSQEKQKFNNKLSEVDREVSAIAKTCHKIINEMLRGEDPKSGNVTSVANKSEELNAKYILIEQIIGKLDVQLSTQIKKGEHLQALRNNIAKQNELILSIIGKESHLLNRKQARLSDRIQSLQNEIDRL